jgi:hypothetical protein
MVIGQRDCEQTVGRDGPRPVSDAILVKARPGISQK